LQVKGSGSMMTRTLPAAALLAGFLTLTAAAQDRLKTMPGHDQFLKMSVQMRDAVKPGTLVGVSWKDGGKAFTYRKDGKTWRYDIAAGKAEEFKGEATETEPARPEGRRGNRGNRGGGGGRLERGRQAG